MLSGSKTIISPTGSTVIPGQNIVYQIAVTNNGAPATFFLLDDIPVGTTFVSLKSDVSNSGGTNILSTFVSGSIGNIFASSTDNLGTGLTTFYLLTVNVDQTAVIGSVIQNTAILFIVHRPSLSFLSPPLTVVDPVADLSVSVLGSPFGLLCGTNKFITTVTNIGPSDATNAVLMQKVNSAAVKFTQLTGPAFTLPVVVPTSICTSSNSNNSSSTSTSGNDKSTTKSCSESYTARATISTFPVGAVATFLLLEQEEEKPCKSAKSEASKLKVCVQVGSDTSDPNLVNNVDHVDTYRNVTINVYCKE